MIDEFVTQRDQKWSLPGWFEEKTICINSDGEEC